MSEAPRFLPFPGERAGQDLSQYLNSVVERLRQLRTLFLYEANPREITSVNLRSYDAEIRDMCRFLDQNRIFANKDQSYDKAIFELHNARKSINLAIDLMEMNKTYTNRKRLYNEYTNLASCLERAIEALCREEE
jgi:hypothetical protein